MRAETHLEVYRPFTGKLREHPVRFVPLWTTGLRTALKQKRALFLLYLPPLIATVIVSFVVYIKYAVEGAAQNLPTEEMSFEQRMAQGLVMAQAEQLFGMVSLILEFTKSMGMFALLAVTWFASGLFCEDRKAGAHQLYFARPLTRLDYALGKFLTAATFALLAMLAPVLVICLMAAVSSPEWSFLTEEWDVVLRAVGFTLLWTVVVSSLVLLASSLASRRSFALVGVFGFVAMSVPVAGVLGQVVGRDLFSLALVIDLDTLAKHMFGRLDPLSDISAGSAWTAVIAMVLVSWTVIWLRIRRLEVVA